MLLFNSIDEFSLRELHDNSFPLPDLTNRLYICHKTAVEDGKIVAIGLVRLTAEGILLTNQKEPLITRARASAEVIKALAADAKKAGLEDCHVFVRKPNVQSFLEHLGFAKCDGQALVINL